MQTMYLAAQFATFTELGPPALRENSTGSTSKLFLVGEGALTEVQVLPFEPAGTLNTGDARCSLTLDQPERI